MVRPYLMDIGFSVDNKKLVDSLKKNDKERVAVFSSPNDKDLYTIIEYSKEDFIGKQVIKQGMIGFLRTIPEKMRIIVYWEEENIVYYDFYKIRLGDGG